MVCILISINLLMLVKLRRQSLLLEIQLKSHMMARLGVKTSVNKDTWSTCLHEVKHCSLQLCARAVIYYEVFAYFFEKRFTQASKVLILLKSVTFISKDLKIFISCCVFLVKKETLKS